MGHKYSKVLPCGPPDDPGLYLGSIDWLIEDEILDDLQIRAIVSVLPHQPQYADEVLSKHSIPDSDYFVYPLEDSADEYISLFDPPGVLGACQFIHARRLEGKAVLVHCDAGVTRSPAVVISYLMKYGIVLHEPRGMPLSASLAHVRSLRERVDVCAFQPELQRLEQMLWKGTPEPFWLLSDRNANMSFPRTPLSARSWSEMQQDGDPIVELALLRETWRGIREMEGGQAAFGRCILDGIGVVGADHTKALFAEVNKERLSVIMSRMLHQIVWCLDLRSMDKLVKFHAHLDLQTEDLASFLDAILLALRERLHPSPEALDGWARFLRVVFNRWAKMIDKPLLPPKINDVSEVAVDAPKLGLPPKRAR